MRDQNVVISNSQTGITICFVLSGEVLAVGVKPRSVMHNMSTKRDAQQHQATGGSGRNMGGKRRVSQKPNLRNSSELTITNIKRTIAIEHETCVVYLDGHRSQNSRTTLSTYARILNDGSTANETCCTLLPHRKRTDFSRCVPSGKVGHQSGFGRRAPRADVAIQRAHIASGACLRLASMCGGRDWVHACISL